MSELSDIIKNWNTKTLEDEDRVYDSKDAINRLIKVIPLLGEDVVQLKTSEDGRIALRINVSDTDSMEEQFLSATGTKTFYLQGGATGNNTGDSLRGILIKETPAIGNAYGINNKNELWFLNIQDSKLTTWSKVATTLDIDKTNTLVNNHINNKTNPHSVTASQVGAMASGTAYTKGEVDAEFAEVIDARNGKGNLKTRLDDEHAQVTEQLAHTKTEIQSGDANLQEQVNKLVLGVANPEATSAELLQSHVNHVGTTFPNLKLHLDTIEQATFPYTDRKYSYTWVRGTTDAATGNTIGNSTRICTDTFCYAENDLTLSISDGTAFKFGVRVFPNYPDVSGSTDGGWIYDERLIPAGTWFKINLSKFDNSALTDTEAFGLLLGALSVQDKNTLKTVVKNAELLPELKEVNRFLYPFIDKKVYWNWSIGYLSGEGTIDERRKFRIITKDILTADKDYLFKFQTGLYNYWIQRYDDTNAVIETLSFASTQPFTTYLLHAGEHFRITIGRKTNDTTEVFTNPRNELYESLTVKTAGDYHSLVDASVSATVNAISPSGAAVRLSAHRGLGNIFPENTMFAYKSSYERGIRIMETDIKFTLDNVAVLSHDGSINRTARNADGSELAETVNIHEKTYSELLDYDFGIFMGKNFAGEKLPKLEDLLIFCKRNNCSIQIDGFASSRVTDIFNIVNKFGMREFVCWSSFRKSDLEAILSLDKKAYVMFLTSEAFTNTFVDDVATLKTDWNTVSFSPYLSQLTDYSIIEYAHTKEIKVEPYVVDGQNKAVELIENGIDGLITNNLSPKDIMSL